MPAYIIAEIDVHDAARYEQYKALAPDAIAHYGGRYLVRGGDAVVLEGAWKPKRVVVLEFPTLEVAKQFHDSPEYRAARQKREGACDMRMIAVPGA
ncbi:MAG TPA: DUF1330 domain-containing protein [Casimicrobiaceae bacterium]|jgi:uncharacterized protein (DUF1330 family)|nr:DUF1330 domain-containing protein [Casimicrobiaceae bacterium]